MTARQKVVVSLLSGEQEFQTMQAADAERTGAREGLDIQVLYAKNNGRLQVEQLYHFIHAAEKSRPVAIVVQTVVGEGLARVASDAAKAGIGWVLLNRDVPYIDALRKEHPNLAVAIVTTDQIEIGRIQGRQFRSLLPEGGTVLYVQGPADTPGATQRRQGVEEEIAGSKIILKSVAAEWTESSGEQAVTSWLRGPGSQAALDLVGAQNDAMAAGARKAITARRPDLANLRFTGCDGLPEGGQRLVKEGQLAATVIVQSNAGAAVSLVAAHMRTGAQPAARVVLPPRAFPPSR